MGAWTGARASTRAGFAAGLAVLWVAAAAGAGAGSDPLLAELGEVYFGQYCASCHGADAKGGGPVAEALRAPPPDLTRLAARRRGDFPADEIGRFIDGRSAVAAHGSREMPVWGERFAEGVEDAGVAEVVVGGRLRMLVEYLASIQQPALLTPAEPGK